MSHIAQHLPQPPGETMQFGAWKTAFHLRATGMAAATEGLQATGLLSPILGKTLRILKLLPTLNRNQVTTQEVGKLKAASRNTSSGDEKQSLRVWVSLGCVVRCEMLASVGNSSRDVSEKNIIAVRVF